MRESKSFSSFNDFFYRLIFIVMLVLVLDFLMDKAYETNWIPVLNSFFRNYLYILWIPVFTLVFFLGRRLLFSTPFFKTFGVLILVIMTVFYYFKCSFMNSGYQESIVRELEQDNKIFLSRIYAGKSFVGSGQATYRVYESRFPFVDVKKEFVCDSMILLSTNRVEASFKIIKRNQIDTIMVLLD